MGFLAEHCGLSVHSSDFLLGRRLTLQYPTAATIYGNSYSLSQQNLQYQLNCSSDCSLTAEALIWTGSAVAYASSTACSAKALLKTQAYRLNGFELTLT